MRYHRAARWVCAAFKGAAAPTHYGSRRGVFFVSASYQGRSLLTAATDLANKVRESMGSDRPPHLITLFATPHQEWGASLADMPQYVRKLLTYEGAPPPVVLGGVLRSVAGGSHYSPHGGPCVALLAAHLPGVKVMPFHSAHGSLPALDGGAWSDVVRAAAVSGAAGSSGAARGAARGAAAADTAQSPSSSPSSSFPSSSASSSSSSSSYLGGGASSAEAPRGGASPAADTANTRTSTSQSCHSAAERSGGLRREPPETASGRAAREPGEEAAVGAGSGVGTAQGRAGPGGAAHSVAAMMLSTPHFVEVEELLRRFGQVAPGMQVIGGVTSPGAWGESESSWGGVWLNDRVFAHGAVGCVLQGPFRLDTIVSPGFRAAGPLMRVTQAHGQFVLELDGQPVQRPLQRAISEALNSGELATSLKLGVGDASSAVGAGGQPQHPAAHTTQQQPKPRPPAVFPSQPARGAAPSPPPPPPPPHQPQLVTRNWFFQQGPPRPFMTVQTSAPISNGTPIQVHLQNYPAAHREMRDRLRAYSEALPAEVTAAEGCVGALALSCSALPFFEGTDVARCLPRAAVRAGPEWRGNEA